MHTHIRGQSKIVSLISIKLIYFLIWFHFGDFIARKNYLFYIPTLSVVCVYIYSILAMLYVHLNDIQRYTVNCLVWNEPLLDKLFIHSWNTHTNMRRHEIQMRKGRVAWKVSSIWFEEIWANRIQRNYYGCDYCDIGIFISNDNRSICSGETL